ncbi:MAG: GNAT family N-acetyltransferase [bacterium]|nr:GNAT family N-acetyltransferase [bacterium]
MEKSVHPLDLTEPGVAQQILALQRAAYRVEADLIGFGGIPPLRESEADLVAVPLLWLGISDGGWIVAALAYMADGDQIDIDRLVVAPEAARQGLGSTLVGALDRKATITVATGKTNQPAHRLYEALGFVSVGETSPVAGLRVTHFERKAPDGAHRPR